MKIEPEVTINFISSIDNGVERVMHSKSDNIEIMINDKANKVIKELFDSFKNRYHNNLRSMKNRDVIFNYIQLIYYKCHKLNPKCL